MPLRTTKTTAGSSSHAVGRRAPARPVERLEARRLFAAAPAAEGDPLVQVFDRVVNENEQQVVFEISVAPGDQPVTMDYATLPGTAAQDADYAPVAGTLTFPASPDPRTATVTVAVVDDLYWEETEWFYLQLSNVTNASLPGDAATYRATATVRDNDRRPAIRVDDVQMTEGDVGEDVEAAFTVSLTDPIDRPVSVEYSTADDTAVAPADYLAASGTLVFQPGETARQVVVKVIGDVADEPNETFALNLRSPTIATILDARGVATIVEDDDHPPTASFRSVSPDPRSSAVESVEIHFSEPVTGLDVSDLALSRDGGPNLITDAQTVQSPAGGATWTLGNLGPLTRTAGRYTLTLTATGSDIADIDGNALARGATESWRTYASVDGRFVFYNDSAFDGSDAAANDADDAAIAPDKQALLPGGAGGFANVTSYSRGINGVGVDVAGLPGDVALTSADFSFKLGNGGDVSAWADAPEPTSFIVRRGAGAGGSDRIMLTFADNAIRNTWLQVTVLANPRTGLRTPDAFYFGNLVGDAGERPRLDGRFSAITVGARDLFATRRGYTTSVFADLSNTNDHNRDGKVNALDLALARLNFFRTLAPFAPGATA